MTPASDTAKGDRPRTPCGRSGRSWVRARSGSSMPTSKISSRWHLDALLKTQGVELPRPELSEPVEGFGGVREQIQLSSGVERDLDRAVVDAIVDPAPFEIQLLDELR